MVKLAELGCLQEVAARCGRRHLRSEEDGFLRGCQSTGSSGSVDEDLGLEDARSVARGLLAGKAVLGRWVQAL